MGYFLTEQQIENWRDKYPRTRRDLLRYLWSHDHLQHVDIVKAGPEYTAELNGRRLATRHRRLDNLSFANWKERFEQEYFPL